MLEREFSEVSAWDVMVMLGSGLLLAVSACSGWFSSDVGVQIIEFALGYGLVGTALVSLVWGKVWPGNNEILACALVSIFWGAVVAGVAVAGDSDGLEALLALLLCLLVATIALLGSLLWGLWQNR